MIELISKKQKFNEFVDSLKKNEIFFIEEEYVVFYELDPTNISNDKRSPIHQSKKWSKFFERYTHHLEPFILVFYLNNLTNYTNLNKIKISSIIFYYINKYNTKYRKKKNFFKRFYYHNILTFNFLKKKLSATLTYKGLLVSCVTPGILTKKLGIESKKSKKSTKLINVVAKTIIKTYWSNENYYKLIIQIRGTSVNYHKIIDFLKSLLLSYTDAYFIYTPVISNNNKRFKKVRSLKKNFRKKYFKI